MAQISDDDKKIYKPKFHMNLMLYWKFNEAQL